MCKYASSCRLCGYEIKINTEHINLQDVNVEVASDCPNLRFLTGSQITLDAMHELIVPKEKSQFMNLLDDNSHSRECSVYDNVIDALGKSLGRYYEIA